MINEESTNCDTFDLERPPLLKDCGFGYVASTQIGPADTAQWDVKFDAGKIFSMFTGFSNQITPNPGTVDGTVERKRYWRQAMLPQHVGPEETVIRIVVFGSTISQLQTLQTTVGATVGGSFGPVSAEVSAEISSGIENQQTFTQETTEQRQVVLKGDTTYAFWELVEDINITFSPWTGTITLFDHPYPINYQFNPIQASSILATYDDSMSTASLKT